MSPLVSLLAEVPLFQLLDADERAALSQMMEQANFAAGDIIFREGEPGERMYVVCSGAVELSTTDKLGQKLILTTASRGDLFGELSLLDQGARNARATVLEAGELLVLDRKTLTEFIRRKPDAALDMMAVMGGRMRMTTNRLRQLATRNANEEIADELTWVQKLANFIAEFSGSMTFLFINAGMFFVWIAANIVLASGAVPGAHAFDPFPFGLLTMAVSLEAIFLSIFVLLAQNLQAAKDHIRSDIEYQVNLKAELEVAQLHEKVDDLHAEVLARLHNLEKALGK